MGLRGRGRKPRGVRNPQQINQLMRISRMICACGVKAVFAGLFLNKTPLRWSVIVMMGTKLRGVLAPDGVDTRMNAQNTGQPHHGGLSPVRGMLAQESTHMAGWLRMKVYSSELERSSCCSHDAGGRGRSQTQCFLKLWELAWSSLTLGPAASVPLGNPLGRRTPRPTSWHGLRLGTLWGFPGDL